MMQKQLKVSLSKFNQTSKTGKLFQFGKQAAQIQIHKTINSEIGKQTITIVKNTLNHNQIKTIDRNTYFPKEKIHWNPKRVPKKWNHHDNHRHHFVEARAESTSYPLDEQQEPLKFIKNY